MSYTRPHYGHGLPLGSTYDVWAHLYERLAWRYGPDRALKKLKGEDHESRLDELAWRCLGEGRARA